MHTYRNLICTTFFGKYLPKCGKKCEIISKHSIYVCCYLVVHKLLHKWVVMGKLQRTLEFAMFVCTRYTTIQRQDNSGRLSMWFCCRSISDARCVPHCVEFSAALLVQTSITTARFSSMCQPFTIQFNSFSQTNFFFCLIVFAVSLLFFVLFFSLCFRYAQLFR